MNMAQDFFVGPANGWLILQLMTKSGSETKLILSHGHLVDGCDSDMNSMSSLNSNLSCRFLNNTIDSCLWKLTQGHFLTHIFIACGPALFWCGSGSRFEVICAGPRHQVRITCYLLTTLSTCCSCCLHQKLFQCHLPTSGWIRPRRHLAHHVWYMPAAETHWSPHLQYSIPAMRIARRVFFGQNRRFPSRMCSPKTDSKKQNWQSFFKSKLQIVYNLCAWYIKLIPYIEMIVLFFSTKSFWLPFCIKTFPALQGSNEAPWGRAFWGAVRHESAACATKSQEPTAWESRRVGNFPPPKKGGSFWALFSHPTHPTQLLFFPGFLLLVWWNLAWNLCMNMFIMPVKHEVATTNEALEGYATQNFSRFITRSSFPKN